MIVCGPYSPSNPADAARIVRAYFAWIDGSLDEPPLPLTSYTPPATAGGDHLAAADLAGEQINCPCDSRSAELYAASVGLDAGHGDDDDSGYFAKRRIKS